MDYEKAIELSGIFKYAKPRWCPRLISGRKKVCVQFAEKHLMQQMNWTKSIFSDEKKLSLDGQDGIHSYWLELQ